MKYILCFGNKYLEKDNIALKVSDMLKKEGRLKDFEFIECAGSEELFNYLDKNFFVLDAVEGINKVMYINDKFLSNKINVSVHDFDLGFFIRLIRKIGRKERIPIIGIPLNYDNEMAKQEVIKILNSLDKKSK
ncbi:MAG: hypothetical protein QXG00_00715 [Candidatus Woesearchaeota archaeon]